MVNYRTIFTTELPHPYNKIGDGPEGPEVRTVADKLRPILVGRSITSFTINRIESQEHLSEMKLPNKILGVRSYGKKVIIDLEGAALIASLGMTGKFLYQRGNHSHLEFTIADSTTTFSLFFEDSRRMGDVTYVTPETFSSYFNTIGPCLLTAALGTHITSEAWLAIFTGPKFRTRHIADVLVDQKFVSGIGWYLMTEILYYSGISPNRAAPTITKDEWEKMRVNAHKVIALSYAYGGFTIESFIAPDGSLGAYPAACYGRSFDQSGLPVRKEKHGNRTYHIVDAIQH